MTTEVVDVAREAARQREFEAGIEQLNAMGQKVITKGRLYQDGRDWEAEAMLDQWVGLYTRNIAEQYHAMLRAPHIGVLKQVFKGQDVAAAIVGAGPSLDRNAESLRGFPGVIIATDGAAKPLTARGIIPDIVVSVDPRPAVIAKMLDYPENKDQVLLATVCINPDVAKVWKGRTIYTSLDNPDTQFFDRIIPELFPGMPRLFCTGNVGNTAVQVAHYMGVKRMVLVGQDYSYPGGLARCQDWDRYPEGWRKVARPDGKDPAFDHRSGKVEDPRTGLMTYPPYLSYRDSLETMADTWKLDIVNATEDGILTGFHMRPLAQEVTSLIKCGYMSATSAHARVIAALEADR